MKRHHYIMENFIEEISSFVFPQLGMIEMDRFNDGRCPALAHQRERSHKTKSGVVISLARLSDNILA